MVGTGISTLSGMICAAQPPARGCRQPCQRSTGYHHRAAGQREGVQLCQVHVGLSHHTAWPSESSAGRWSHQQLEVPAAASSFCLMMALRAMQHGGEMELSTVR